MILHYFPGTRAFPVLWLLEEIQARYEIKLVNLKAGEQNSQEYRAINPMRKVPALIDGEVVVSETGAILQYVAESHPDSALLPEIGDPTRAACLRWLFFVGSNLEPAMAEKFGGWTPNPYYNGWGDLDRVFEVIDGAVQPGPWLLGERFSVADVYLASDLRVARMGGMGGPDDLRINTYMQRAEGRPGFMRAAKIDAELTTEA